MFYKWSSLFLGQFCCLLAPPGLCSPFTTLEAFFEVLDPPLETRLQQQLRFLFKQERESDSPVPAWCSHHSGKKNLFPSFCLSKTKCLLYSGACCMWETMVFEFPFIFSRNNWPIFDTSLQIVWPTWSSIYLGEEAIWQKKIHTDGL